MGWDTLGLSRVIFQRCASSFTSVPPAAPVLQAQIAPLLTRPVGRSPHYKLALSPPQQQKILAGESVARLSLLECP